MILGLKYEQKIIFLAKRKLQILGQKIKNYALDTEHTGDSLEQYSERVLRIMEEEEFPTVHGCVIGISGGIIK